VVWIDCSWYCMWETVAGADILAQASSSRLGEDSRNSPRFCWNDSPRREALVLSDALSRSGESDSPKRVLEENLVHSARILV